MLIGGAIYNLFKQEGFDSNGGDLKFYNKEDNKYRFRMDKLFNLKGPTSFTKINDNDNDMLITTKGGRVYYVSSIVKKADRQIKEIFNIKRERKDFTDEGSEEGLLGSTINPNNKSELFLSYTVKGTKRGFNTDVLVSKFELNSRNKDLSFIKNIIRVHFRKNFHHAGTIVYTGDNKLYLSTGDGGPQGDPHNTAQSDSLNGKLLEINPQSGKPTIIARGMRNPWKFTIDQDGRFFIGDVGWDSVESIKLIENRNKEYNFGWSYFEGSKKNKSGKNFSGFDPPIFEYPKSKGSGAVVGGYYIEKLQLYIFGDYHGILKALELRDNKWVQVANQNIDEKIYTFGYDGSNLFAGGENSVYRIRPEKIK